jgi:hypothetical protein
MTPSMADSRVPGHIIARSSAAQQVLCSLQTRTEAATLVWIMPVAAVGIGSSLGALPLDSEALGGTNAPRVMRTAHVAPCVSS